VRTMKIPSGIGGDRRAKLATPRGASAHAPERSLCIVLHDVAPATWARCRWLLDTLAQIGDFPVTLLAVPSYHGGARHHAFERWLASRAAGGDEVALHGFDHLDRGAPRGPIDYLRRRVYTRGEGEFGALDFDTATRRLRAGSAWLREVGIAPAGFVAPAWLLSADAWRALRRQPFAYTCTLRHLVLLDPAGAADAPLRRIACQSQVYSSSTRWRQQLSVLWNEALARLQQPQPVVRLELHPGDDAPALRRSWQRLLRRQAATRRARTLREVAEAFRTAPAPRSP
jgi:uncharacterized protein